MKKVRIVFFNGSFDPSVNAGHCRALREIKEKYPGSRLVVGLNSDALLDWMIASDRKGQEVRILPFAERKEILSSLRDIDEIIETHEPSALNYLVQLDADVYVLTEEWTKAQKPAIDWIKAKGGEIYFSPRYLNIHCNSDIRRIIIEGAK